MPGSKNGDDLARQLVRSGQARAEEARAIIDDLIERVVPVVQGQIVTDGDCPPERRKKSASGFAVFSAELCRSTVALTRLQLNYAHVP